MGEKKKRKEKQFYPVEVQLGRTRQFAENAELANHVFTAIGRVAFQRRLGALLAVLFVRRRSRVPDEFAVFDDHPVQVVPLFVQVTVWTGARQPAQHPVDGLQQRIRFTSANVSRIKNVSRTGISSVS